MCLLIVLMVGLVLVFDEGVEVVGLVFVVFDEYCVVVDVFL